MHRLDTTILHGTDYYPEQWLERSDVISQDIALMKESGINVVTLGVFAWSMLEPSEGVYTLNWLDEIIIRLKKEGIGTILATPSGARPPWMAKAYPQVLRTLSDGRVSLYGGRHNHCLTSTVYKEKCRAINEQLAQRFANREEILYWHISNELQGACYCSSCKEAFRSWLYKEHNGDLALLNDRWYSRFWSHVYTDWDEIDPPMTHGEKNLHGLIIDWKRCVSELTAHWVQEEIAAIRVYDQKTPTTVNLMGLHDSIDYHRLVTEVDVVSADIYPTWGLSASQNDGMLHTIPSDGNLFRNYRFQNAYYRGLSPQKRWLLMESTPAGTNWHPITTQKRPGVHLCASLAAIAGGSQSIQYFQWRQGRGGWEQFHGSVIDHQGKKGRAFFDVQRLSEALQAIGDITSYTEKKEAALLLDTDSRWMIEQASGPRNDGHREHIETAMRHFEALQKRGVAVDIISRDASFDPYCLIILPMAAHLDKESTKKLEEFVQRGGSLVVTYSSGIYDRWQRLEEGGYPFGLQNCLGIEVLECDQLEDGHYQKMVSNRLCVQADARVYHYLELIACTEKCEVLSTYEQGLYAGSPVITKHHVHAGYAYYIAARCNDAALDAVYQEVVTQLPIDTTYRVNDLPPSMYQDVLHSSCDNLLFLYNPTSNSYTISSLVDGVSVVEERIVRSEQGFEFLPWSTLVWRVRK